MEVGIPTLLWYLPMVTPVEFPRIGDFLAGHRLLLAKHTSFDTLYAFHVREKA